jgi:hypothetical protein
MLTVRLAPATLSRYKKDLKQFRPDIPLHLLSEAQIASEWKKTKASRKESGLSYMCRFCHHPFLAATGHHRPVQKKGEKRNVPKHSGCPQWRRQNGCPETPPRA